jgi:acylpyruvate hydrolase
MKIICIGRNYAEHIEELKNERPSEPVIFMKPDTALLLKNRPFYLPNFDSQVHHEIELVVRINHLGKNISAQFAPRYYSEIGLGVDFTARDLQDRLKQKGLPWEKAKAFDASAPLSEEFIPANELDLTNIDFRLEVNGEVRQRGNSAMMLYPINELIEHISKFFTLKIGDLIYTGTPTGVGPVQIGDRLQGFIGEKKLLDFLVK